MNMTELKKLGELLGSKKEEDKKGNTLVWVLAIIGAVAAVAAIAYAVYRYFTPLIWRTLKMSSRTSLRMRTTRKTSSKMKERTNTE